MIDEKRTFKFPDGEGGWILKVQLPDGSWEPCDEEGNLLEPPVEKPAQPQAEGTALKKKPASRSSRKSPSSALRGKDAKVNTCLSVVVSEEAARKITAYVGWKSIQLGRIVSRSEVLAKAIEVFMDRDSEFKERFNV
jgi:hypothetical protein